MPHLRQTLFAVVVAALLSLTGCAGYRPPLHHTGVPAFLAERVEVDGSRWEFLKSLRRRMDRSAAQAHTIIQSEDGFTALLPWAGDPTGGPEALTGGVAVIFFSGAFAPAD